MDPPSLSAMPDDRRRALWLMLVGREQTRATCAAHAHEISVALRDAYGIAMTRQRVTSLFASERTAVAHQATGRSGRVPAHGSRSGRGTRVGAGRHIHRTRHRPNGNPDHRVAARLPYRHRPHCRSLRDGRTLDLLAACTNADEIRLLTANIAKPTPFTRDLEGFRREHKVPIMVVQVAPGVLHDRYAIDDYGMVLFGTSLNGIGKKQTFVVAVGPTCGCWRWPRLSASGREARRFRQWRSMGRRDPFRRLPWDRYRRLRLRARLGQRSELHRRSDFGCRLRRIRS